LDEALQLGAEGDPQAVAQVAAQVQGYRETIESALAQPTLDIDAAARLLDVVDELARLAPADPMARGGRAEVAARLAFEANKLVSGNRYDEALAMLDAAGDLISEADLLRSARTQMLQARNEFLAGERQDE